MPHKDELILMNTNYTYSVKWYHDDSFRRVTIIRSLCHDRKIHGEVGIFYCDLQENRVLEKQYSGARMTFEGELTTVDYNEIIGCIERLSQSDCNSVANELTTGWVSFGPYGKGELIYQHLPKLAKQGDFHNTFERLITILDRYTNDYHRLLPPSSQARGD